MSVSCIPSAECDDLQDSRQLFDMVSIICLILFGTPLALVSLRIFTNLNDLVASSAYIQMGLDKDVVYSVILAILTFVPIVYTYLRYRLKAEELKSAVR
jgi:hypothetical protein